MPSNNKKPTSHRVAQATASGQPVAQATATKQAVAQGLLKPLPAGVSAQGQATYTPPKPRHTTFNVNDPSAAMWMIFCENGVWNNSPSAPEPLTKMLETNESTNGWTINRVYFLPNSDSYIVINGTAAAALPPPLSLGSLQVQQVPADVLAAVDNLTNGGGELRTLSWVGDGIWAAFGTKGWLVGANIPATLKAKLDELEKWAHENIEQHEQIQESPYMVVFAPSADWLLCTIEPRSEGEGTYYHSDNFPTDIVKAAESLPSRVGLTKVEFVPGGGWVMIGGPNEVIYGGSGGTVLSEIQQAVEQLQAEGNVVTDCAALALNEPIFNMGPFQQPPPVGNSQFDVVQGAGGGAMQTVIHAVEPSGKWTISTSLRTSNFWHGFHGSALILPLDYTGAPMYQVLMHERWGNEKAEGEVEKDWTREIPVGLLKIIRGVLIHHMYSPNSLATDVAAFEAQVGSALGAFTPTIQAVGSLLGGGKGGGASAGKSPTSG
jgi:hypothetical protein